MHGGHQATLDAPLVIDDLGQRGQAVGGARSIGDDRLAGVGLVVHAVDEHRRIVLRRGRHDDLPGAGIDVLLRGFLGQEQAGGLDHHVHVHFVPLQVGRVAFLGQADLLAVDQQVVALHRHVGLETTVHGVVLEHVRQIVRLQQIVDGHDFDVVAEVQHRRAQDVTPDATETVDTNLDCHVLKLLRPRRVRRDG